MTSNRIFVGLFAFLALLVSSLRADAQGENGVTDPKGFVRLLNAVGQGTGRLDLLIDGRSVREKGFALGDVTGGISRKPGSYTITCRRDGLKEGVTTVQVAKDETTTLIPFAEFVPSTETKEAFWKIRILRLKQTETPGKLTATVVNVTKQEELKVEIGRKDGTWEPLWVKKLGLERTELKRSSGYVPLRSGDTKLNSLSVGSSGNFVSVIYEDAEGKLGSQNFQDFKYLSAE